MSDAPSTRNGLWIVPNGDSLFIDDNDDKNPHDPYLKVLMKVLRAWGSMVANGKAPENCPFDFDGVMAWIQDNPSAPGEEAAREWAMKVARVALECGLTLVLAGSVWTSIRELDKVKSLIQKTPAFAELDWPHHRILIINCIHKTEDTECYELSVADLLPQAAPTPHQS